MTAFSHIDSAHSPTMVDVGDKAVTKRTATAETRVRFPQAVANALRAHAPQKVEIGLHPLTLERFLA